MMNGQDPNALPFHFLNNLAGPDHFFSFSHPTCEPFAEQVGKCSDRLAKPSIRGFLHIPAKRAQAPKM